MWYIIVIVAVLFCFLCYRYRALVERYLPWLWKNIGQPIFNYYYILSVRKITKIYFGTVATINIALPAFQIAFDKDYKIKATIFFGGTSYDWVCLVITVFLTIAYWIFMKYETKKIQTVSSETIQDVVDAVTNQVGRGSLEIVNNSLPQISACIKSLHVDTAFGLLETMRTEVDKARTPYWSLLARIDYLMGACKRYSNQGPCRPLYIKAYDEMEKGKVFDKEIIAGRIYVACRDKDFDKAANLSCELKDRDNSNIWGWIPLLLNSKDISNDLVQLPKVVRDNSKLYAELLWLGRDDILEAIGAQSITIPEMKEMTIDNFVEWPFWLSIALTQFVSNWRLGSDGGCNETESSKKMLALSEVYFSLLNQTELPDLMPDMKFIHTFVSYVHEHSPKRLEEIAAQKPSDHLKELYYLVYASMLQSEKRDGEALALLASYDGMPSFSIQNDRLHIAILNDNIGEIGHAFKRIAEEGLTIPGTMMVNLCAALHICPNKVATEVGRLRFENEVHKRLFIELFNFQTGNTVDAVFVREHLSDIPKDMISYMCTLLQKHGMTDEGISLLEPVLSEEFFDYRNIAYLGLLQSDRKYSGKLYSYLKALREKGLSPDDLLQKELQMSERMFDFERMLQITNLLIERHPENGILMEHHLMALYRNNQKDEIERLFDCLGNLQFPEQSVQNIFNVYLINGLYEKALSFLYDEIQKSNSQTLRDFFFQVHLHKEIEGIIMRRYEIVTIDSFVLIDVDGKEEYTSIRPGSYLEELIGKKEGEEISYISVNREVKVKVLGIFNRYFKLMKEVMTEIAKNRSKQIRSFTIEDLEGGEGLWANLAKLAGTTENHSQEEEKMNHLYKLGKTTLYYFINQNQLFPDLYKLLFGSFGVYMTPTPVVGHLVQISEVSVNELKPVLDLSSLLMLHELQLKYNLSFPTKMIVPKSMQIAIYDAAVRERNGPPSFLGEEIMRVISIREKDEQTHPMLEKLNMLLDWIGDNCEIETDDELLNEDMSKQPNDLSIIYMQTVRLAYKPDRILVTEDWTATQSNFQSFHAMNALNWLLLMRIGNEQELNDFFATINYIGCRLTGDYIFSQYVNRKAKKANNFDTCIENIEFNPYNATEALGAGNLILSGIVNPSDRIAVTGLFASVFKNLEYRQAALLFNTAKRMYRNEEYQHCLMDGFRTIHPVML